MFFNCLISFGVLPRMWPRSSISTLFLNRFCIELSHIDTLKVEGQSDVILQLIESDAGRKIYCGALRDCPSTCTYFFIYASLFGWFFFLLRLASKNVRYKPCTVSSFLRYEPLFVWLFLFCFVFLLWLTSKNLRCSLVGSEQKKAHLQTVYWNAHLKITVKLNKKQRVRESPYGLNANILWETPFAC